MNGNKQSIFYDGASRDMQINLLFKHDIEETVLPREWCFITTTLVPITTSPRS